MLKKSSPPSSPATPVDPRKDAGQHKRSLLQADLHITGSITSSGVVDLAGTLSGDLEADSLVLQANGTITGDIRTRSAAIDGSVNGAIHAKTVAIAASAHLQANITAESLALEPGAEVEGALSIKPAS